MGQLCHLALAAGRTIKQSSEDLGWAGGAFFQMWPPFPAVVVGIPEKSLCFDGECPREAGCVERDSVVCVCMCV